MQTRIITIANRKGGSGKTTVTVNLAAALSLKNQKVLVVDLDPQCHATLTSGIDPYQHNKGVGSVVMHGTPIIEGIQRTPHKQFDVLPSYHRDVPFVLYEQETNSKAMFEPLGPLYDFILIDTPPSREDLLFFALSVSTELIIPVQMQFLAMEGLAELLGYVTHIKRKKNPMLRLSAIVPTMIERYSKHGYEVAQELKGTFVPLLIKQGIRKDKHIPDASWNQIPITIYKRNSKACKDFLQLAEEIY